MRHDQILLLATFIENWRETALGRIQLAPMVLAESRPDDATALLRGQDVFLRTCAGCHAYGDMRSPAVAGPDLTHLAARVAADGTTTAHDVIREAVLILEAAIADGYTDIATTHPCGAVLTVMELKVVTAFLLQ